jgi:NAD(P)-dependent dehydrogenase (short-subunit alcohol dehydrogenase family)
MVWKISSAIPGHCERTKSKRPTAIVTGAARGIGQAIAIELAHRGADLAICDLLTCNDTVETVRACGSRVLIRHSDVGERASIEAFFESIANEFGRADILVNNAAQVYRSPLWTSLGGHGSATMDEA